MEAINLTAQSRELTGKKVAQLRRQGQVPAILYGHKTQPLSLQIEARALQQVLREAGTNRLITLSVDGVSDPRMVLVRDLQRDTISHALQHVDLYEVIMTERITAEVPIELQGESSLVKRGEALLFQGLDTIEIECLPGDLPPQIDVDLSSLQQIDATILVKDLKAQLSDAVEILTDLDEIVVKLLLPEEEEVEEAAAEAGVPEVEIIGREKKEEEGEAETEKGKADKSK